MIAILLAALSGLVWGTGDFAGGKASQRTPALVTAVLSKAASLPLLGLYLLLLPAALRPASFGWGAVAGAFGMLGMIVFYRALAGGAMAIVAPVSAVTAAVVPLAVGLVIEGLPGPAALVGVACAIVAIGLVSAVPGGTGRDGERLGDASDASPRSRAVAGGAVSAGRGGVGLVGAVAARAKVGLVLQALFAGAGFGLFFVFLKWAGNAADGHAGLWPVLAAHSAALTLGGLLLLRGRFVANRRALASATVAGPATAGVTAADGGTRAVPPDGARIDGARVVPQGEQVAAAAGGPLVAAVGGAGVGPDGGARVGRRGGASLMPRGSTLAWVVTAGLLDMTANVLYLIAVQGGMLSIVAPIGSLYPVTTVLLAMLIDRERMRPIQLAGLGLAATALVLVAS